MVVLEVFASSSSLGFALSSDCEIVLCPSVCVCVSSLEKWLYPIFLHRWHVNGCQVKGILSQVKCFWVTQDADASHAFPLSFCLLKTSFER